MADEEKLLRNKQSQLVGQLISELMTTLSNRAGIPASVVLVAAHAEVVATMASVAGIEAAVERCESAADSIRNLPAVPDQTLETLETMVPHGRV